MAQLYEEVTLARDVPEYNLKQGDSAILRNKRMDGNAE